MYILKSRGMAHSNQIREFLLTDHGVELKDVYLGPEGVLTGSMRLAQEAREKSAALSRQQEIERRQRELRAQAPGPGGADRRPALTVRSGSGGVELLDRPGTDSRRRRTAGPRV